jgi:hypothetical protein
VASAIRRNQLPSRAPYKLREALALASATVRGNAKEQVQLRHKIVCSALGLGKDSPLTKTVCCLVDAGFQAADRRANRGAQWDSERWAHAVVAGLLLARGMASGDREE